MTDLPSSLASEIATEQRHLDRVYARLDEVRAQTRDVEAEGHRRAQVGHEGALYERDVLVFHAARRRQVLDSGYEGLVFGRIDLTDGEARHIGRLGLRDDEYEPLVIDWRAPAAAPFYQATAEQPLDVVRRRVIQSAGTRVVGLSDDLLDPAAAPEDMTVVGEGSLMATLARARGTAMRDIVATIQREQDEAIRAPADGTTLIEGGPGTGKTAVALHRVAYLLYTHRNRFAGGGVLVVGPSATFVRYIEQVLPSLGEEGVVLRPLGALVEDTLGVRGTHRDPPATTAVKGSLRMRRVLARAVRDTPPDAPTRFRTVYAGEVLTLDARALAEVRRAAHHRGTPPNAARAHAVDALLERLWRLSRDWDGPPERWNRNEFVAELRDRPEVHGFLARWWPVLTATDVLAWCADPNRLARYARRDLTPDEVRALAASFAAASAGTRADAGAGVESGAGTKNGAGAAAKTGTGAGAGAGWSVADIALLDELRVLLGEPPALVVRRRVPEPWEMREIELLSERRARAGRSAGSERSARSAGSGRAAADPAAAEEYALIVVDEAQDVSPMQWRMLGRRGRHASWTLVGDPAQSAWDDDPAAAAERVTALDAAVGKRTRRHFGLSTNYRNSAEIFAVAGALLHRFEPDVVLPRAVRNTGHDPRWDTVRPDQLPAATRAAARRLLDEVEGTVGVVVAADQRAEVASWLADPGSDRLSVVDSIEAKGLEYDGVVVVEPGAIVAESGAGHRVLYVALSRATHQLAVLSTDPAWAAPSGASPAGGEAGRGRTADEDR